MDYIITDAVTSPLSLAHAYSEKLAYMPHTFFVGDHAHMLSHLTERVIVKDRRDDGANRDTVTVMNATNLGPILEKADVVKVDYWSNPFVSQHFSRWSKKFMPCMAPIER